VVVKAPKQSEAVLCFKRWCAHEAVAPDHGVMRSLLPMTEDGGDDECNDVRGEVVEVTEEGIRTSLMPALSALSLGKWASWLSLAAGGALGFG
jgi:hypothetical protein